MWHRLWSWLFGLPTIDPIPERPGQATQPHHGDRRRWFTEGRHPALASTLESLPRERFIELLIRGGWGRKPYLTIIPKAFEIWIRAGHVIHLPSVRAIAIGSGLWSPSIAWDILCEVAEAEGTEPLTLLADAFDTTPEELLDGTLHTRRWG
jgi:hypothetical protein